MAEDTRLGVSPVLDAGPAPAAAASPTPAALPSPAVPTKGVDAGLGNALRSYVGDVQKGRADLKQATAELQGIPLPKMTELPKPPQTKTTDFMEMFGSAAMGLAGLGSLMTRRPLTNALNAGAAVMQAYHKNDMEAAQKAYQNWEVETQNAMRLHQFEQEAYRNAVDKSKTNVDELRANLTGLAASFKDDVALSMLNRGDTQGALALITGRQQLGGKLSTAQEELAWRQKMSVDIAKANALPPGPEREAAMAQVQQAVQQRAMVDDPVGYLKTQAEKTPTGPQIYTRLAQSNTAKWAAEHNVQPGSNEYLQKLAEEEQKAKPLSDADNAKYQEAHSQTAQALDHADAVLNIIQSTPFAVGGGGILGRPLEAIGNIIGNDITARSEFVRELGKLNQAYARAEQSPLTAGRPLASQQKIIDGIIGGLGWGQTTKNTVDAIHAIQDDLYQRQQDIDARRDKTWKPDMVFKKLSPLDWSPAGGGGSRQSPASFDDFPTSGID